MVRAKRRDDEPEAGREPEDVTVVVTAETEELTARGRCSSRPDATAPAPPGAGDGGRVLGLQRAIGNAAVSQMLRGSAGRRTLQRALTADDHTAIAAKLHSAMAGWGPTRKRSSWRSRS